MGGLPGATNVEGATNTEVNLYSPTVFTLLAQEQLIGHQYASFFPFCATFYTKILFVSPINHLFSPIQGTNFYKKNISGENIIFKKRGGG